MGLSLSVWFCVYFCTFDCSVHGTHTFLNLFFEFWFTKPLDSFLSDWLIYVRFLLRSFLVFQNLFDVIFSVFVVISKQFIWWFIALFFKYPAVVIAFYVFVFWHPILRWAFIDRSFIFTLHHFYFAFIAFSWCSAFSVISDTFILLLGLGLCLFCFLLYCKTFAGTLRFFCFAVLVVLMSQECRK
jgi:hypothetical protein